MIIYAQSTGKTIVAIWLLSVSPVCNVIQFFPAEIQKYSFLNRSLSSVSSMYGEFGVNFFKGCSCITNCRTSTCPCRGKYCMCARVCAFVLFLFLRHVRSFWNLVFRLIQATIANAIRMYANAAQAAMMRDVLIWMLRWGDGCRYWLVNQALRGLDWEFLRKMRLRKGIILTSILESLLDLERMIPLIIST